MVENERGCLVISLDFELMWGNIESWSVEEYGRTNISNVREVIGKLLMLFEKYKVRATFATVGLIMNENYNDRSALMPRILPSYQNQKYSPYENHYIENIKAPELYFAHDVVEQLKSFPFIEIGTHTYSHYYCWEEGQTIEQFEADIQKAVEIASKNGVRLQSIVFPRNQVPEDYLTICYKYGINAYRGNPAKYFAMTNSVVEKYKNRICRILDTYINLNNRTSYRLESKGGDIINVPASRFLRPYSPKIFFLEKLRLRRIRKEMEYAALHNEVYHLWWHPHNFGANIDKNLIFLERILKTYQELHNQYGMVSMTMGEVSGKIQRH